MEVFRSLGVEFSSVFAVVLWGLFILSFFAGVVFLTAHFSYKKGVKYGQLNPFPDWAERRQRLAIKIATTRELLDKAQEFQRKSNELYEDIRLEWKSLGDIVNFEKWWEVSHWDDKKVSEEIQRNLLGESEEKQK
ncbi:MAG: hypothetical protein AB7F91_14615 [Parvularculaceae bacterium]